MYAIRRLLHSRFVPTTERRSVEMPAMRAVTLPRRSNGTEAADHIRDQIFRGVLRPGERVPQDEIAAELGISRIPVREGLIALERDGWVTIHLNRGAYVNALDADAVRDSYELFGTIYGFALARAVERSDDSLVEVLAELESRLRRCDDPGEFRSLTLAFHTTVVEASRSPRVKVMLRSATALVSGNFFAEIDGSMEVERRGTTAIVRALRKRDVEKAAAEYQRMLVRQGALVARAFEERGLFEAAEVPA
jgi:DNA-binding GntR family transcriptional regulator